MAIYNKNKASVSQKSYQRLCTAGCQTKTTTCFHRNTESVSSIKSKSPG